MSGRQVLKNNWVAVKLLNMCLKYSIFLLGQNKVFLACPLLQQLFLQRAENIPTTEIYLSAAALISAPSLPVPISYFYILPGFQCRAVITLKIQLKRQWENDQNEGRERKGSKGYLNMWAVGKIN